MPNHSLESEFRDSTVRFCADCQLGGTDPRTAFDTDQHHATVVLLSEHRRANSTRARTHSPPSIATIGDFAAHLDFHIPTSLQYTLMARSAKTGTFVASPGTGVAPDDVETHLRSSHLARPGLDR